MKMQIPFGYHQFSPILETRPFHSEVTRSLQCNLRADKNNKVTLRQKIRNCLKLKSTIKHILCNLNNNLNRCILLWPNLFFSLSLSTLSLLSLPYLFPSMSPVCSTSLNNFLGFHSSYFEEYRHLDRLSLQRQHVNWKNCYPRMRYEVKSNC